MAKITYTVNLKEGLITPFPDHQPKVTDSYSSSGAFMPAINVLDVVNALPTETGYASYFGEAVELGQISGETYVQDIIVLRTFNGIMLLVAFCPGGLYLACPGSKETGSLAIVDPLPSMAHLVDRKELSLVNGGFDWIKIASGANPSENPWKWWSYALVKNRIYFYQQGLGAIVEVADKNGECVIINWFNPLSIIGTYNAIRWRINIAIASDCTLTSQTMDFGEALGTYTIANLDKAHIRAALPELWQAKLRAFIGGAVAVEV